MQKLKPYAHYLTIIGLALLLMAIGKIGGGQTAWADNTKLQTVPTRTPTPSPSNGDNGSSSQESFSKILGLVTDLSSGQPGAGVTVVLNDVEVTTDSVGKYSLSGLKVGEFVVYLKLGGEATPAQDPVVVRVDGKKDSIVNLAFYGTGAAAEQTDSTSLTNAASEVEQPQAEAVAVVEGVSQADTAAEPETTPQFLPESGSSIYDIGLLIGLGITFLALGIKSQSRRKI
jgi:hypothetical protein